MHPCPGNWMAFGRASVYSAQASHAFSAGIKCRHCNISKGYKDMASDIGIRHSKTRLDYGLQRGPQVGGQGILVILKSPN